ncbi:MAG: hypothetical protein HQL11_06085 [Candidatus Omnitrophica bacterium]|nr:hypothetical protein [Candidatus Omnitrophota bacterium]
MGNIKFGSKFKRRPVKTLGQRRARVKVHRKRLVAAGLDPEKVAVMDAKALREALKKI